MKKLKYSIAQILSLITMLFVNINFANPMSSAVGAHGQRKWGVINIDGNVSLPSGEDARYWNRHSFSFDGDVRWAVDFEESTFMYLKTSWGDAGHVATGMWWTQGFRAGEKVPINGHDIRVDFDVVVEKFDFEGSGEWLRVALACAVQRSDGKVVYTELDLLDSPNTKRHPSGNTLLGGDVIYQGGDVVEFVIDEAQLRTWSHHSIDLTRFIDRAWKIQDGDLLESVYIVIESEFNPVEVRVGIDNLWIYMSS